MGLCHLLYCADEVEFEAQQDDDNDKVIICQSSDEEQGESTPATTQVGEHIVGCWNMTCGDMIYSGNA